MPMDLKKKIRISKFFISLGFSVGYAAYFAYSLYYYLTYRSGLGIALLCLIALALALSIVVTAVSYRINLKGARRPRAHRFVKIAKYSVQLLCSGLALAIVLSAVRNANAFSVIMACISIPFLLLSVCVNILAEYSASACMCRKRRPTARGKRSTWIKPSPKREKTMPPRRKNRTGRRTDRTPKRNGIILTFL